MGTMADREDDRKTVEQTRTVIIGQVEALLAIPSLDLIEYQRDLDTVHTALAGVLRHHRAVQRKR